MSSVTYYEELIRECNIRIIKYEDQIQGLKNFSKENESGMEIFTTTNRQRRDNIGNSLVGSLKHPMIRRLHLRLTGAIDESYEGGVVSNFQEVTEEIHRAIRRLEGQIDEEQWKVCDYQRMIKEIEEEERRAADVAKDKN